MNDHEPNNRGAEDLGSDDLASVVERALTDSVEDVQPPDSMLETIRAKSSATDRSRVPLLATAAAVVVIVGLGVWWASGPTDTDVVADDTTTPSPSSTTASTAPPTTPPPTTAPGPIPLPTGPPTQLVGATEDGRVVLFDLETGDRRELLRLGDPRDVPVEGPGPNAVESLEITPDGQSVLVSTCCEPAGGDIRRVPLDPAEPLTSDDYFAPDNLLMFGYQPTYSPNGRYLAVATISGLQVEDASTGEVVASSDIGSDGMSPTELVWRPDGRRLLVGWARPNHNLPPESTRPLTEVQLLQDRLVEVNDRLELGPIDAVGVYGTSDDPLEPSFIPVDPDRSTSEVSTDVSGTWGLLLEGGSLSVRDLRGDAVALPALADLPPLRAADW